MQEIESIIKGKKKLKREEKMKKNGQDRQILSKKERWRNDNDNKEEIAAKIAIPILMGVTIRQKLAEE